MLVNGQAQKINLHDPTLYQRIGVLVDSPMKEQLDKLIRPCIKGDRRSQRELYDLLAPKMFVVCLRYSKNREDAEEVLQEGFINVFTHLKQYSSTGSFEGWVRRIMVNCALRKFQHKSHLHAVINIEDLNYGNREDQNIYSLLNVKELIKLVQLLTPAYRMVFNLYVFEKMKHREIAQHLGISEGTSKSNLSDAKIILQKAIQKMNRVPSKLLSRHE